MAKVPVGCVPGTRAQVDAKSVNDASLDPGLEQPPHRLRRAHIGVEECLGPIPERLDEPIGAVRGRGDGLDERPAAERRSDRLVGGNRVRSMRSASSR